MSLVHIYLFLKVNLGEKKIKDQISKHALFFFFNETCIVFNPINNNKKFRFKFCVFKEFSISNNKKLDLKFKLIQILNFEQDNYLS